MPDTLHEDIATAVRSTALLADVTIGMWSGERSDRRLMDEVKVNNNATGDTGRVVKNLLAGADAPLKDVKAAFTAVRTAHYALTLPWVSDPHAVRQSGARLLPTKLFDQYMQDIGRRKHDASAALNVFIDRYPALVQTASHNLGTMVHLSEYPPPEVVRGAFKIVIDIEPIPDATSFKGLPDAVLERLGANLEKRQHRMIETATTAMWGTVRDRVTHLAGRLADPEAVFKSTTLEAARNLGTLVPGWNLVADARADEIVHDIARMLPSDITEKTLRGNPTVRKDTSDKAQAIVDKLASWGL